MIRFFQYPMSRVAAIAVAGLGVGSQSAFTQENLELQELQINFKSAVNRVKVLQVKLEESQVRSKTLTESLASSNQQSKQALEKYETLRSVLSGLGIDSLLGSGTMDASNKRLLDVLAELKRTKESNQKLADLFEQIDQDLAPDKLDSISARKKMDNFRAENQDAAKTDFELVAVKEDLALCILKVNPNQVLPEGTTFEIQQEDGTKITGYTIDSREEYICLSYQLEKNLKQPKVGQIARIIAQ
jgi:hypothetical protein